MAKNTLRSGAVRGDCTMGDVFVSLCTPREASWIILNCFFHHRYKYYSIMIDEKTMPV